MDKVVGRFLMVSWAVLFDPNTERTSCLNSFFKSGIVVATSLSTIFSNLSTFSASPLSGASVGGVVGVVAAVVAACYYNLFSAISSLCRMVWQRDSTACSLDVH